MQIEGGNDRCPRSEPVAQPGQELALGVLVAFGDHGAMQMQQGAVDRCFCRGGVEDHPRDLLERGVGDDARRVRVGGDRMNEGPAVSVGGLKAGAERRAGAAERLRDRIVEVKVAAPDQRHVGLHPAEGVGLVHEPSGEHAFHRQFSAGFCKSRARNVVKRSAPTVSVEARSKPGASANAAMPRAPIAAIPSAPIRRGA